MKKPEKKEYDNFGGISKEDYRFNHACDLWQTYHTAVLEKLADEEEIENIIWDLKNNQGDYPPMNTLAKAISKRIKEAL